MPITLNPIFDLKPQQPSIYYLDEGVGLAAGIGNPEGLVIANIGALISAQNGHLYQKQTGNGLATGWVQVDGGGGGSGTVITFSAGNLSPLFTSSVANPTTTPALTFSLNTQTANTVFAGPSTGAAAAPTFRALVAADIPGLADPPNFSLQYNNGSNVFEGDAGLTFDPATTSLLVGATGLTGNVQLRNSNGFAVKLFTNNPVAQNVTWPDTLPAATGRVMAVSALSGSNWTIGYLSQSAFLDLLGSTQGQILYRDGSAWTVLSPGTSGQLLQTGGAGANPSWVTAAAAPVGANPTGTIGLSAINGVATTFLRSDGAPALSQSIAPTWTGQHIHQLSNAAAVSIGPNGDTNPVVRVVTNVASQATGLSITGNAAGTAPAITVLSSGTNEDLNLVPKGAAGVLVPAGVIASAFSFASIRPNGLASTGGLAFDVNGNAYQVNSSTVNSGLNASGVTVRGAAGYLWTSTNNVLTAAADTGLARYNGGIVRVSNGSTGIGQLQVAASAISAQRGNIHVEPSANTLPALWLSFPSATGSDAPVAAFRRSRGTNASPTAVQDGDILARIIGYGQFNTSDANFTSGGEIRVVAKETWSVSQNGAQLEFYTAPLGGGAVAQVGKFHASGTFCVGANPTTVNAVNKQVVGNSIGFNTDVLACFATGSVDTTTTAADFQIGAGSTAYFNRYFELGDGTARGRVNVNGQHEEQVGRSASFARTPGVWKSNITPTGNSGAGETTLHSYTIEGTSLRLDKDGIRLTGAGRCAANANAKQLRFKFGATTFGDTGSVVVNGASFTFDAEVIRTGATAQLCFITVNNILAGVVGLFGLTNSTTAAETLSGNVTLAITGQGAATNDIILDYSRVEYNPATI